MALSETVQKILDKCGQHTELVMECAIHNSISMDDAVVSFSGFQINEIRNMAWSFLKQPLQRALQVGRADCKCSPFGRLLIQSCSISGSIRDKFHCIRDNKSNSDLDLMFELGPISWVKTTAGIFTVNSKHSGTNAASAQHSSSPSRLAITETDNPGFVILLQERHQSCKHHGKLELSGEKVRSYAREYFGMGAHILHTNGPAISSDDVVDGLLQVTGTDFVLCLYARGWWPSDEYFQRCRSCDWPPEKVRINMREFGVHLVPVGLKGSLTEESEWRVSFSRSEAVTSLYVPDKARIALIALKICKEALGKKVNYLKSYHIKTALFWLCQETPVEQWTNLNHDMQKILDYLQNAVASRNLPCYFWAEINLLRSSSEDELKKLKNIIIYIGRRKTRVLVEYVCTAKPLLQDAVLKTPGKKLSERDLRICLVRHWVKHSVRGAVWITMAAIEFDKTLASLTWSSGAADVVRCAHQVRPHYFLQHGLFMALSVAPDDVISQMRLTPLGDDLYAWDAAPLMALLSYDDLEFMLGYPEAVFAWCQRQRQLPPAERPAGLPADLSSPRGRADLLLNTPLLIQAISESVPAKYSDMCCEAEGRPQKEIKTLPKVLPDAVQNELLSSSNFSQKFNIFRHKLGMDEETVRHRVTFYRDESVRFFSDPSTQEEFNRIRNTLPDSWDMKRFVHVSSK